MKILQSSWKAIVALAVFGIAIGFGLSLAKEPAYVAESRILIRYLQTGGIDAYTASRAAGKIGETFVQVVETELFLDKVLKTPYMHSVSVPSSRDTLARREFWNTTVSVSVGINSTILEIKASTVNPNDAENIVQAVTYVLMTQGNEFHGAGNLVSLTQVDAPALTKSAVRPKVIATSFAGAVAGILAGLFIGFIQVASKNVRSEKGIVFTRSPSRTEPEVSKAEVVRPAVVPQLSSVKKYTSDSQSSQKEAASQRALHEPLMKEAADERRFAVRTIFDDLVRLGLDVNRLTVQT